MGSYHWLSHGSFLLLFFNYSNLWDNSHHHLFGLHKLFFVNLTIAMTNHKFHTNFYLLAGILILIFFFSVITLAFCIASEHSLWSLLIHLPIDHCTNSLFSRKWCGEVKFISFSWNSLNLNFSFTIWIDLEPATKASVTLLLFFLTCVT